MENLNAPTHSPPAHGSAEWVSVDDALPPWKEYVLAFMPWSMGDRYMIARRLPSRAKNQEWQESSYGCNYRYGVQKRGRGQSITHWMRLTPPNDQALPQGGAKETYK